MNNKSIIALKYRTSLVTIAIFLSWAFTANAQEDRSYILENTNRGELARLAPNYAEKYRAWRIEALQAARINGWDTVNLIRIDAYGRPQYWKPSNNFAATMTNTIALRNTFGVQGENMEMGIWEATDNGGYAVRSTHVDLVGRVTLNGGNQTPGSHATHVAGTLIGNPPSGSPASSRGMAPAATLQSYGLDNAIANMTTEADNGMLVSNHSYGVPGGWGYDQTVECTVWSTYNQYTWLGGSTYFNSTGDDPNFGRYDDTAEDLDEICWNAPFYLPVFAAGNFDDEAPETGTFCDDDVRDGDSGTYVDYDPDDHPPINSAQVSTIPTQQNAKNILTVGNLQDDETINISSSRGKTDDGRIKPDICGNGTSLFSADSPSDVAYDIKTGTSMASPNVAGSLILLQQLYESYHGGGIYMRSATLKGLALHTATDKGFAGPDFTYGWGLLNANAAGDVIWSDATEASGSNGSRILENTLATSASTNSYYLNGGTSSTLKVTMAYTDKPGTGSNDHNSTTPELLHDLDLRLYNVETGAVTFPYATGTEFIIPVYGDNDVDNVEQLFISPSSNQLYEIRVHVEGSLTEAQPFSIIVTGENRTCQTDISHGSGDVTSYIYRASNNIHSNGNITSGDYVHYEAGNEVSLTTGFNALPGSQFKATARDCQ